MEMYKADLSEYEKNQLEIKAFNLKKEIKAMEKKTSLEKLKKELEQVEKDLGNV